MDEIVSWEGGPLRVAGGVSSRLGRSQLKVVMDDSVRRLISDGAEMDLESFIGRLDVVDLTAERMKVLRGGPEERRRFLDRGVVGLQPSYLRALGEYRRVLQQRNALLRGAHRGAAPAQLGAWDERLTAAAGEIHRRRREYAVLLGTELGETVRMLFPDGGSITMLYRPSPREVGEGR